MNALTTVETQTENIVAPVRGRMLEMAGEGGENLVAKISNTLEIAIRKNPDILKCTQESIQTAVLNAAADGLLPDGKQAVILPYREKYKDEGGTDKWREAAQYQPMVHGVIKRLKELGDVYKIVVDVVREKDEFEANRADHDQTHHKVDLFEKDRGQIVGAYCIFKNKDGEVVHREIMDKTNLDKVRSASKSSNSPAWNTWEEEMCKKAVLRRGSKYITLNDNRLHEMIERMDAMFEYSNQRQPERADPFTSQFDEPKGLSGPSGPAEETPVPKYEPAEIPALKEMVRKLFESIGGLQHNQPSDDIRANGEVFKDEAKAHLSTQEAKSLAAEIWKSFQSVLQDDPDRANEARDNWMKRLGEEVAE